LAGIRCKLPIISTVVIYGSIAEIGFYCSDLWSSCVWKIGVVDLVCIAFFNSN